MRSLFLAAVIVAAPGAALAQDAAAGEKTFAQCRACHMIERTYMGIDRRSDHSFRVPRPDLAATGSPDACTDCHADRRPACSRPLRVRPEQQI